MTTSSRKVLAFDIWGQMGHFRKYYGTSSAMTYSIPPPTTVRGIIGAFLGLERKEYNTFLDERDTKISVYPVCVKNRWYTTLNIINTKDYMWRGEVGHSQVNYEFLMDPRFRVYLSVRDRKVHETLKYYLGTHRSVYDISLGLTFCLANYSLRGEYTAYPEYLNGENDVSFSSAIPMYGWDHLGPALDSGADYTYQKEARVPIEMDPDRTVRKYGDVMFDPREGHKCTVRAKGTCWNIEDEHIVFF